MPEVTLSDPFGAAIHKTVRAFGLRSGIEIGSWDGSGSTAVLVDALRNAESPSLVCIESEADRHAALAERYAEVPWVSCHHGSSISRSSLTPQQFSDVWLSPYNRLRYPESEVRKWWDHFMEYMDSVPPNSGYLEKHNANCDFALIDGSEFTGWDEVCLLRDRVRVLFLDDVFAAYKCSRAHESLRGRPEWHCIWADAYVRNGASIWVRE